MPGFDGTGPAGRGPMTGGRRGRCVLPRTEASEGESATPVSRGDAAAASVAAGREASDDDRCRSEGAICTGRGSLLWENER